jgi:hypothetical protein
MQRVDTKSPKCRERLAFEIYLRTGRSPHSRPAKSYRSNSTLGMILTTDVSLLLARGDIMVEVIALADITQLLPGNRGAHR